MTSPQPEFWTELLGARDAQSGGVQFKMWMLRKHGRPFLLLPPHPRLARISLDLYPAQTSRARAAKLILSCLLKGPVPFAATKINLRVSPEEPFVAFLRSQTGTPEGHLPRFGVLAGNPATEGQRFLLLVFGPDSRPKAVVKAGLTASAQVLIDKEYLFLTGVPPNTPGAPKVGVAFTSARVHAFAMDFVPGRSPSPRDAAVLPTLLGSWVNRAKTMPLAETPAWQRLERAAASLSSFPALAEALRGQLLHPALQHGDFAPWNIKVSADGTWTALDWERGEMVGIPAWDWFHYVIQDGVLVQQETTARLVDQVEALLASEYFKAYARDAAIDGVERPLLLGYLAHCIQVIKPSEGLSQTRELLQALSGRWRTRGGPF